MYSSVGRIDALQAFSRRFESDCFQFKNSMKYLFYKDKRRRLLFTAFEKRTRVLRALIENFRIPLIKRYFFYSELLKLQRDVSVVRIRNRCTLTNRPRAVYQKFGLSRLMFRKYV